MNKSIRLLMSDIDGTLLTDALELTKELTKAVNKLIEKKIPVVLASARSPKGMWAIAKELGVQAYPMVCYNGALILANGRADAIPLFSHHLEETEVKIMIDVLTQNFPKVSINLYSGTQWYVQKIDSWALIESKITQVVPMQKNLQLLLTKEQIPVHKLLLIGEAQEIAKLLVYCQKLNLTQSAFYLSKENYLEVTHKNVSKATALREVADYYQLSLEQTMTTGDNFNDIPMLQASGLGVAMGNAPEEVKQEGDKVTTSNNDSGVAKAIETYIINNG